MDASVGEEMLLRDFLLAALSQAVENGVIGTEMNLAYKGSVYTVQFVVTNVVAPSMDVNNLTKQ